MPIERFHRVTRRVAGSLCAVWLVLASLPSALADWQPVTGGISYQSFQLSGPRRVFVARLDRSAERAVVDTTIARGRLFTGAEVVPAQVERAQGRLAHWQDEWGTTNRVVAAINGSFFNRSTGIPTGGQVSGGFYAEPFDEFQPGGFAFMADGSTAITDCVFNRNEKQVLTLPDESTIRIDGINQPRGDNDLVLYTSHLGDATPLGSNGFEVILAMARPIGQAPLPGGTVGVVRAVGQGGGHRLLFDEVVLSGTGGKAEHLGQLTVGNQVTLSLEITPRSPDCSEPAPLDLTGVYGALQGSYHFLEDGTIRQFDGGGAVVLHPRTAVAYNDEYIFFVVVDGRSDASIGMTTAQLAAFCRDQLGATDGVEQDGGGSSILWLDGSIMNSPSDGSPRPVANSLVMVSLEPSDRSNRYWAGDQLMLANDSIRRHGPGPGHAELDTVPAGTMVEVFDHGAAGRLVHGENWWLVDALGSRGWLVASDLPEPPPRPDGGPGDGDGGSGSPDGDGGISATGEGSGGCGCRGAGQPGSWPGVVLVVAAAAFGRRRRDRLTLLPIASILDQSQLGGALTGCITRAWMCITT